MAPEVVEYVSLLQVSQIAEPGELLYVPAVQLVQDPPLGPDQPALQVLAVKTVLRAREFDLSGHAS